ncbi:protein ASPARTIC PROTEASE IN GUARD CELL 1-like isoform X2 [Cornus florida]|nr:protein ASPARTIC PROTEASE IN GUARD CELL 1-like isoform X2 [Cornus florida]XP_059630681.1 protein ASPARTIC PROTEASE IN GUARD CELL 1-like isoform X2 [Cornus florida]XP_059630682.1 protein ASPARTIC PROTEASE IN GUARD CELL 1-like isoform X2 [Cornus florida]
MEAIWFVFALTLSAHLVLSLPFNVSPAIQLILEVTQLLSEASNSGEYVERAIVEPGHSGEYGDMISLVSQLKASSFSYCLVDRDSTLSSTLDFNTSAPSDSVIVPMIRNKQSGMLFFLELTGISVIGQLLPIPPAIFELQEDGSGGVLLDSGTHVTRLPPLAYELLRDSFAQKAESLPPYFNVSKFLETCYELSGMDIVDLPTVAFHFAGDKTVNLLPLNYMLQYRPGIFCFAFTPSEDQTTILSNTWHQKMRVNFDITNSVVGFSPNKC